MSHARGQPYPPSVALSAQALHLAHPDWSNQRLADELGVGSEGTIRNMLHRDMSETAVEEREEARTESRRLLSLSDEDAFCGEIIYRDLNRKDTSSGSLLRILWRDFHVSPADNSWLTKLSHRNFLSLHKATLAHLSEFLSSSVTKYIDFLDHFRSLGLDRIHMVNMDPTAVYDDERSVLQLGPLGGYAFDLPA